MLPQLLLFKLQPSQRKCDQVILMTSYCKDSKKLAYNRRFATWKTWIQLP